VITIRDGLIEKDMAIDSLTLECASTPDGIASLYREIIEPA
jgi:hypothetical protein